MPLSAASQRSTSPRGFLINNLFMHARARPASQQPTEFTHQPASSRIHACARAANMPPGFMHARAAIQPPGFMHARARPASQQDSYMRARGHPASRSHACARAAIIQRDRAGFMHASARPASQQQDSCMRARPSNHQDSCMLARGQHPAGVIHENPCDEEVRELGPSWPELRRNVVNY